MYFVILPTPSIPMSSFFFLFSCLDGLSEFGHWETEALRTLAQGEPVNNQVLKNNSHA